MDLRGPREPLRTSAAEDGTVLFLPHARMPATSPILHTLVPAPQSSAAVAAAPAPEMGLLSVASPPPPVLPLLRSPPPADDPRPATPQAPARVGSALSAAVRSVTPSTAATSQSPTPQQDQAPPAASVAFAVLCGKSYKAIRATEQLCRRLWKPHHFIAVHVDVSANPKAVAALRDALPPGTKVISTRRTKKESFETAMAELDLLREALASGIPWVYVQMLSGDCYPTMRNADLAARFRAMNPRLMLCDDYSAPRGVPDGMYSERIPESWPGHRLNIGVVWGSQWVALTRDAAEYVVTDREAMQLESLFGMVRCPVQSMMHTVLARRWPHFCGFTSLFTLDELCRDRIAEASGGKRWWHSIGGKRPGTPASPIDEARELVMGEHPPMFCTHARSRKLRREIDALLYPEEFAPQLYQQQQQQLQQQLQQQQPVPQQQQQPLPQGTN